MISAAVCLSARRLCRSTFIVASSEVANCLIASCVPWASHRFAKARAFRLAAYNLSSHCPTMLRPDKKYSVYDLRQLKGKRCLTHVHVKSPEEAGAAEAAGIDLLSCSFDSPASQARLPLLVAAAPKSFISAATPHGMASG